MSILEDLMKSLGLGGPTTPAPVPQSVSVPTPQSDIPVPYVVPVPQDTPNVRGLYGDITIPEPSTESIPYRMGQVIGNQVEGGVDGLIPIAEPVRNIIDRAMGIIGRGSDASFEDLKAGFTGEESKANWDIDPGTGSDKDYAAAMLTKQAAIKKVISTQPKVKNILDSAAGIDPAVVEGLSPEDQAKADEAARRAALALEDDNDPEEVMSGASKFLGSLFDDPAIRQALIYYTGARLMGYSGSGSGMAAGNVLLQGWANQDKQDLLTQTANAKKAEDDALDMSKTVSMWDPRTRKQEIGYMSKSGNFQRSSGGEIYNAREQGLQTYDKSNPMHRTYEELDSSNVKNMDNSVKDVLANISNNSEIYPLEQRQAAQALFADGADLNEAYAIVNRSARSSGVDTGSVAYQTATTNSIRKYIMRTIKNPEDAFSGNNTAAMADAIRTDQLKAELTVEGSIPEFVFGKGTWTADGVSQMEEGYELPYEAMSKLYKRVDSLNAGLMADAAKNKHSDVKIRSLITTTKTLQRLASIFKDTVMKDPEALRHWTDIAESSNTNAMGAWLASGKSTADHKYLGINNPDIAAKFELLVDKQLKKK
jgi:hypothetical protein